MKTTLLLFVSLFIAHFTKGQIIVNPNVIHVPCCSYSDSLDYNLDGNYDIKIISESVVDNSDFMAYALGDLQLSYKYDSGQVFNYFTGVSLLNGTTLGCYGWYNSWVPGTGTIKYVGFKDPIAPGDTIFGWVKMGFNGMQNSCYDTIITYTVAYNQTPNVPILAGQQTLSGIENINQNLDLFDVITLSSEIFIINKSTKPLDITAFNILGEESITINDIAAESRVMISPNEHNCLLFFVGRTNGLSQAKKIFIK